MDSAIIIGAGMSGLTCAHVLKESGVAVTLIDKARGVGGRMATRRSDSVLKPGKKAIFDHGAQFFTVRDPRFSQFLQQWESKGVIKEWCRGFSPGSEDGHPRYIGLNGMTSAPKDFASDQNVILNSRVNSISNIESKWLVITESGVEYTSETVILTPPIPQSLHILDNGDFRLPGKIRQELESVIYDPCIAVLAEIDGPSNIPDPGGMKIENSIISWVCDNYKKGISTDVNTITVHTSAEFSTKNWDNEHEDIANIVLNEVSDLIGANVIHSQIHRWRYCEPQNPLENNFLIANEIPTLVFCGEAFGGPKVEGAFISGLETAEELLRISQNDLVNT